MSHKPIYQYLEQKVEELETVCKEYNLEQTTIFDLLPYHCMIQILDNKTIG